ncbi:MAG TPA: SOS response-associated peptidase [Gammaproteobacteria bacterium]|nr:SOS response-associated peptidase [Gammaproteobacteria bacterium]
MCGRFALFATSEQLAEYFTLAAGVAETLPPRFNLTPGQAVAVVRERDGVRRLDLLRWGLVPFWAKDASIGQRLINARLDSITTKPAFREAFARRRCLIVASGFYEWSEPVQGRRRPFFVRGHDERLLAFAGLWERWRSPDGKPLETCVIVTTDANAALAPIHERMPMLVAREDHARWLDPRTSLTEAAAIAGRAPRVESWQVSLAVNDPRNDDETLIEPLAAAP